MSLPAPGAAVNAGGCWEANKKGGRLKGRPPNSKRDCLFGHDEDVIELEAVCSGSSVGIGDDFDFIRRKELDAGGLGFFPSVIIGIIVCQDGEALKDLGLSLVSVDDYDIDLCLGCCTVGTGAYLYGNRTCGRSSGVEFPCTELGSLDIANDGTATDLEITGMHFNTRLCIIVSGEIRIN